MSSSLNAELGAHQLDGCIHESQDYRRQGRLIALRTKAEIQKSVLTIEAYVAAIPLTSASAVLKNVDNAIRELETINLNHLRRLVKPEHLPTHIEQDVGSTRATWAAPTLIEPPSPAQRHVADETNGSSGISDDRPERCNEASQQAILYFLACATSSMPLERLQRLLLSAGSFNNSRPPSSIRTITVPITPPVSHDQAKQLSQEYWPTVYKGGNPFGPHPSIVARATEQIQGHAGTYIGIALRAGMATSAKGRGESIGAVVVDRNSLAGTSVVATAGDARWDAVMKEGFQRQGNVMAHAVMRVIAMVAKQRVVKSDEQRMLTLSGEQKRYFADEPLTDLENDFYSRSNLAPGGYLCVDLELYLTHEPCVMCSMAINHSRFGRVVFGQRMPHSGGLTADSIIGNAPRVEKDALRPAYGLWWCSELNWKFLAWQWIDENPAQMDSKDPDIQA